MGATGSAQAWRHVLTGKHRVCVRVDVCICGCVYMYVCRALSVESVCAQRLGSWSMRCDAMRTRCPCCSHILSLERRNWWPVALSSTAGALRCRTLYLYIYQERELCRQWITLLALKKRKEPGTEYRTTPPQRLEGESWQGLGGLQALPETGQLPIKLVQMLKGNSAMDKARVCYYINSKVVIFVL
jgi:hypothetical protein